MATIIGKITINNILYLEVDTDPSSGGGTIAPIGSHANTTNGAGEYYKFGTGNTDWVLLGVDGLISVTYAQLTSLIGSNGLIAGQKYLLTDFATKYTIPYTTPPVINTGTTEPLILEANSVNTIYANAISTLFPKDELLYEVVDSSTAGGDKGRIYYRCDTINNNSTWYDWRVVLFRRWETTPASGIFAMLTDNGGAFQDLFTFNNSAIASGCYGNSIDSIGDVLSKPDKLNNIVFNCVAINNTFGKDCWDCNFVTGGQCINNVIGDNFNNNYSYAQFGYNQFSQQCNQNVFNADVNYNVVGTYFSTNTFTLSFSSNEISDNFYFNNISGDFVGNSIGAFCQNNTFLNEVLYNVIAYGFSTNTLNANFNENTISDIFAGNDLNVFIGNTIDSNFNSNTVSGASFFWYNSVGDAFSSNIITGSQSFEFNKIGNVCNTNTFDVTTNPCQYNVIGDNFSSNTIGDSFQRNSILSDFSGNILSGSFYLNIIGAGMYGNTIGTDFKGNNIGDTFNQNTIGAVCQDNVFKNGIYLLIISDNFNNNIIDNDFNTVDFSGATLVYSTAPKYNKNILRRQDGNYTLWYIDSTDVMIFKSPTT